MSGAAFLRIKKLKGGGIITVAARHNKRVTQAELGATGSIDPTRSHLNESLRGPLTADDVAQLAKRLMTDASVVKLRRDAVTGLEIIFSLPVDHQTDDRIFFADCTGWAESYFAAPILSSDIHRDEGAPHCHVLLLPLINGRMVGGRLMGGTKQLMEMQKHFHAVVASRHGLRKASPRLCGTSKQAAASAVLANLRNTSDPALKSTAWATIRDGIESNPGPWLLALGLELDTPKAKPLRTLAAIFTSPGKGRKYDPTSIDFRKAPTSIDFAPPAKDRSLCSVDFPPKLALPAPTKPPPQTPTDDSLMAALPDGDEGVVDIVRIKDNAPALYDPTTGEYFQAPPARRARQAADAWVATSLARH